MKSRNETGRKSGVSNAPRVDLSKRLPYGAGRLKEADIKKAVSSVVTERLAAERAEKTVK